MINKMKYFLDLIRYKNLVIIILIQYAIKICLIDCYLNDSALSHLDFSIYLSSLIAIIAGGYIINDIYDILIDKINKPEKIIIDSKISRISALKIYYILNLIGISGGFYVSSQINKLYFGFIFIFFAFSLFKYSRNYKTTFLIGNLQIAFLTALSIITLALFDLIPNGIKQENGAEMTFYIILCYSAFSFITTLIREIIKDLEDIEGDKEVDANTFAINIGIEKTKKTIIFLTLTTITAIAYFQYFQYSVLTSTFSIDLSYWGVNLTSVIYTCIIQILLIILAIKINISNTKLEFYNSSKLCKIIMLFGILSIPLFSFLHLN